MIILNDNRNVNIPDYNDLINKPSINGVTLEGDVSAAELGIVVDTTNFYTKNQSDNKFQPKGNYLTSIPSNYATKSYVDDAVKDIKIDASVDLSGYATESWVRSNYQPKGNYLTSVPSNYVTDSELQGKNYATNDKVDEEIGKLENSISDKQDTLVSGLNVKTINGKSILGSGNIVIEGGGGSTDLTGYATEDWVGANYQPKGNYLTEIPSEYVTEEELNDAITGLGGSESVAYLIIKDNMNNTYSYVGGSFEDVVNAYNNNQPYFIYVPNGAGTNYYSLAETTIITNTYIQCLSFAHTGVTHTWRYWRLSPTTVTLYSEMTYEYATKAQIGDINTILEKIIG